MRDRFHFLLILAVVRASGAEGQAVADRSCWTEDLKTCSISAKTATSSQVRFTFMLRQADESLCMDSCASSSTVVASLDEIAGAEEPETCSTGYCIFTWSSPAGQKAGFHTLLAVVGSNSTNTTLLFSPADGGATSSSKSFLSGTTLNGGPVDSVLSFYLTLRDKFDNTISSSQLTCSDFVFSITLGNAGSTATPWCAVGSASFGGTFEVSWTSTVAGAWTISVSTNEGLSLQQAAVLMPLALEATKSIVSPNEAPLAGNNGSLDIYAKDKFGNSLTASGATFNVSVSGFTALDGGDKSISGLVLGSPVFGPVGRYTLTYSSTRSGIYSLLIKESDAVIGASPVSLKVEPHKFWGPAMGPAIIGDGATSASAGHEASFEIRGVDKYGNRYSQGAVSFTAAIIADDSGVSIISNVHEGVLGSSICKYMATLSGSYSVSISLTDTGQFDPTATNANQLDPFKISVSAEESRPTSRILFLGNTTAVGSVAGAIKIVKMHEQDEFGNLRSSSLELFTVSLIGPYDFPATVLDTTGGKYDLIFAPTICGAYRVEIRLGSAQGTIIPSSEFSLLVEPAAPHHSGTMIQNIHEYDQPTEGSVTKAVNKFSFRSADQYGNALTVGGYAASFSIVIASCETPNLECHRTYPLKAGSKSILANPVDLANGFYGVEYTTTVSGFYSAEIRCNGLNIVNSPSRLFVEAGVTQANSSYAVIEGMTCSRVLLPSEIQGVTKCTVADHALKSIFGVRLVDVYGNTRYKSSANDLLKYSTTSSAQFYNENPPTGVLSLEADVWSKQEEDGLQVISFLATVCGQYATSILHYRLNNGSTTRTGAVQDNPIKVFVQPARAYAQNSFGYGLGLSLATVGQQSSFFVFTRDKYMNTRVGVVSAEGEEVGWSVNLKHTDDIFSAGGYEISGAVTGQNDGKLRITYAATKAGVYVMNVGLDINDHLSGSPFQVTMYPNTPASPSYVNPSYSYSEKVFMGRVAISPVSVRIQSVDQYGNLNSWGGFASAYTSQVSELPNTTIDHVDHHNGSYSLLYHVTKTGNYVVDIHVGGEAIVGSPVTMVVKSGPAMPRLSTVRSVTVATAGITVDFSVESRDEYFNVRESGGENFRIRCSNGDDQNLEGRIVDYDNGTYSALCYMTKSGSYEVSVSLVDYRTEEDVHVMGSPFPIEVYANVADPKSSGAFGSALSLASAGEWSTFKIFARDKFYNPNTGAGGASFTLVVRPSELLPGYGAIYGDPVPVCPSSFPTPQWKNITAMPSDVSSGPCRNGTSTSVDIGNGTFVISYMWTQTGEYAMLVSIVSGQEVRYLDDSPFNLTLKPGVTDIARSVAIGDAYEIATAGESMTFHIVTVDRFGNTRTSKGGDFVADLKGYAPLTTMYAPEFEDLDTGSFRVTYSATASGKYSMSIYNIKGRLQNSPKNISVFPSVSAPGNFIATGEGILFGKVGDDKHIYQELEVQANDKFHNVRTLGGDQFYSHLTGGWNMRPDGVLSSPITIPVASSYTNGGRYKLMYTTTKSGKYQFNLQVRDPLTGIFLHVSGSPFTVHVSSGAISEISPFVSVETGEVVRLTNPGTLNVVTAGKKNFFIIIAIDKYGNPRTEGGGLDLFNVSMVWDGKWGEVGKEHPPMNMTLKAPVMYVGDTNWTDDDSRIPKFPGQYRVTYGATIAGLYRLVATYNSKPMVGHFVGVEPDVTAPAFCSSHFPLTDANGKKVSRQTTAGVRYSFTIYSRDRFHNLRTKGGDEVTVNVSGAQNSYCAFNGKVADAQIVTSLLAPVHVQDEADRSTGNDFGIERKRTVCLEACIVDNADGTYHAYINPTVSGYYQVLVAINSSRICQPGCVDKVFNPYTIKTVANQLYPPLSVARGEGLSLGTAGTDAEFVIQARDIYGNSRVHGRYTGVPGVFGGEFFASYVQVQGALITPGNCKCTEGICTGCEAFDCGTLVNGEDSGCSRQTQGYPKVSDNLDGTYSVKLKTTQASNYTLQILVSGRAVLGSPFKVIIKPSVSDPSTCIASGNGLYKTMAGKIMEASVRTRDQFGNKKTMGGDSISVHVVHTNYPFHCARNGTEECLRCENNDPGCFLFGLVDGEKKPLNLEASIADSGSGLYTFSYFATASGQYKLYVRMMRSDTYEFVDIGSKTIYRSPFPLNCVPDVLNPRSSTISGEGASLATVFEDTSFRLWPRDRFGNVIVGSRDSASVSLCAVGSDCTPEPGSTFVKLSFFNFDRNQVYQVQDKHSRGLKLATGPAIKAVARPNNDGSTTISFVMADTGKYQVNLDVLDTTSNENPVPYVAIQGSPFNMSVHPDDPDPSPEHSRLEMVERLQAGYRGTATVYLNNRYGISLKKTASSSMIDIVQVIGNPSEFDFRLMNQRDGSFLLNFSPTRSGAYSFSVRTVDADSLFVDMQGSPVTMTVAPADTDPKTCIAFVTDIERIFAGRVLSYVMQSRDRFGNDADPNAVRNYDIYKSFVLLSSSEAETKIQGIVTSRVKTKYEVKYTDIAGSSTITRSGQYKLWSTNLDSNVINSPHIFYVLPDDLAPAQSVVDGSTGGTCTAGVFSTVRIQAKDKFGNRRTSGGLENFLLSLNTTFSPKGAFSFNTQYLIEGETDASFRTETAGKYLIHVTQSSIELLGSPFYAEVLPAMANAHKCHNNTRIPRHGIAGETMSFGIQAVDEFGNFHFTGGSRFDVVLKGLVYLRTYIGTRPCHDATADLFSCVTIVDLNNGNYLVEFTPTISGDYVMEGFLLSPGNAREAIGEPGTSSASPWIDCVECVNEHIPERQCMKCRTLSVEPATVNVDTSIILGQSSEWFSSGEQEEFIIFARDSFKNVQTGGGLNVSTSLRQIQSPFAVIHTTVSDLCAEKKCGQYLVKYVCTRSGLYMLSISVNGNVRKNSQIIQGYPAPTADPVQSGLPYIGTNGVTCKDTCVGGENCCLLGEAVSFGLTGTDMAFEIVSRDRYGNEMTRGGESFTLDVSGPMLVSGMVEDLKNGRYIGRYKVLLKGVYVLALFLRGIHVGKLVDVCTETSKQCFAGSPVFGLQISDPGTGLEGLKFSGALPPRVAIAGQASTFLVDSSDETSKRKFEFAPFEVSMQSQIGETFSTPIVSFANDTYSVTYNVELSGIWRILVTAAGQVHCVGSPFTLLVLPAEADAVQTLVTSSGHVETLITSSPAAVKMAAVKDNAMVIYLIPRDQYLNERSHPEVSDDVRFYTFKSVDAESSAVKRTALRQATGDYAGQYFASFTASDLIQHWLKVFVSGQPTSDALPISVHESARDASPMTVAYGAGLHGGVAGATITFTIYARDDFGCQLTNGGALVVVMIDGKYQTSVIDNKDGTYLSQYTFDSVNLDGYEVEIFVNGNKIRQSSGTFRCKIVPGMPAIKQTEIVRGANWMRMNGIDSATTAIMSDFQLLLKDEYHNSITEGLSLESIQVSVSGPSYPVISVRDRYCTDVMQDTKAKCYNSFGSTWHENDGSFLVSYATTAAGRYTVYIHILGIPVEGSPFVREVEPNVPGETTSYASGLALSNGVAGVESVFHFVLRDEFGNTVKTPATTNITLRNIDSHGFADAKAIMTSSVSDYEAFYTATVSGSYELVLNVNGFHIKGSPFKVEISPGITDPSKCIASGPGLESVIAGSVATFTIFSRDRYGNYRTQGGDDFKTNLAGQQLVSGGLIDFQNGTYISSFVLMLAGEYSLTAHLGVDRFVHIFPLQCLAAEVNGQAIELVKRFPPEIHAGACRNPTGTKWQGGPGCEIDFQARDRYGSEIKHCNDVVEIAVTGQSLLTGETILYNGTAVDIQTGRPSCSNGFYSGSVSRYFDYPDPNTCRGPCNGNAGITIAGTYWISIKINGLSVYGSPFRTTVSSADSYAQSCTVSATHVVVGAKSAQRDSTAGVSESFTIRSRDRYGNVVLYDPFKPLDTFAVVMQSLGKACDEYGKPIDSDAVCLVADVVNNLDSTHTVSYIPKVVGKYELVVVLVKDVARVLISNSPFKSVVKSNAVSIKNSLPWISNYLTPDTFKLNTTAGEFTSFIVLARDEFDNVVESSSVVLDSYVTRRGLEPGDTVTHRYDLNTFNNDDGSYEVSFTITTAAMYTVSVEQSGMQIKGFPAEMMVLPGPVLSGECTCEGGGFAGGIAGIPATYTILARDMFGNKLINGGEKWSIHVFTTKDLTSRNEIASIRPEAKDNNDGTYSVTYRTPETGRHRIMTWHVQNGIEYQIRDHFNDKVVFVVDDGYSVPGQSFAFGAGIKGGRAGEIIAFTTQLRNEIGVNRPKGGSTLSTELSFMSSDLLIDIQTLDMNDGSYRSSYKTNFAGMYKLSVKLSTDHIQGSPFEVTVFPGETSAETSSILTLSSLTSIVSETVTFKIISRDKFYNEQVYDAFIGPDPYVVKLELAGGEGAVEAIVQNNQDGTYQASYMSTRSGVYFLYVTLKSASVETRDDVTVSPGPTVTENCLARGSGVSNMEAGQVGFVEVIARDLYGNLAQTGSERVEVTITKEGGAKWSLGVAEHCDSACIAKSSCPCSELKPGFYALSYQMTHAAGYKIEIKVGQNLLPRFPLDLDIAPSMIDTTRVCVVGCEFVCKPCHVTDSTQCQPCDCPSISRMQAGVKASLALESRDRFGNRVMSGGKSFRAVMSKNAAKGNTECSASDGCVTAIVEGALHDNKDGTYQVTLIGSVPGDYVLNISRGGVSIMGAPFALKIVPGYASAAPEGSSFALDPIATAGKAKTFSIRSRDVFGNKLSIGGERYVTQIFGTNGDFKNIRIMGNVDDNDDGTYFAYFVTEKAGLYNVSVKLDGLELYPGPLPITVLPGAVDPSTSSVSGTGLDPLQSAGDDMVDSRYIAPEIRVVPRDMYGNVYSFDTLHIEAVSSSGSTIIRRSTRQRQHSKYIECGAGCGQYVIYNPLTVSGSYSLDIQLHVGGIAYSLLLSPKHFQVEPSVTDSSKCTYDQSDSSEAKKCTTGRICTFTVQAVDFFGNKVRQRGDTFEAKFTYIAAESVTFIVIGTSTEYHSEDGQLVAGKYTISYRVTISGNYIMQLSRYGLSITNSPSIVEIKAGNPVASACTTTPVVSNDGVGYIGGLQFDTLSFTIYARDQFGNIAREPSILPDLAVSVADLENRIPQITPLAGGRYRVEFMPSRSGLHDMTIKVAGESIMGSPFSVDVVDIANVARTEADHRFCTVDSGQYFTSTVNQIQMIPLKLKNNIGRDLESSFGAKFEARIRNKACGECLQSPVTKDIAPVDSCCIDHSAFPPLIKYFSVKAGLASLDVYMVRGDLPSNPAILKSPFEMLILPGDTRPDNSILDVETSDALKGTVGFSNRYTIQARDAFGNQQTYRKDAISDVDVFTSGPSDVATTLVDGADGSFAIFCTVTRAGLYSMAAKIAGIHIKNSPFTLIIQPENIFVPASTFDSGLWQVSRFDGDVQKYLATAGTMNKIAVQSRDAFGNIITVTSPGFSMSMKRDTTDTKTMTAVHSGVYEVHWNVAVSGTYFGSIFGVMGGCTNAWTCTNVKGSPFTVEVLPDSIVAEKCIVYGAGTTYAVANQNAFLFVMPRDMYGNDVVSADFIDYFETKLVSVGTKRNGFVVYAPAGTLPILIYGQSEGVSHAGIKMIYKALMPGRYMIDVHYNKTKIGGTRGLTCGAQKPCPVVATATSPSALSARFSDSGGHIYVEFDQHTNKANISGDFSCGIVLSDDTLKALAADPNEVTCRFLSPTRLDVVLGFGATILVNEAMQWKPNVIKRRPVCKTSDFCFDYSNAIEGKIRINRPRNPVSPTAILKAPASVGPCDSLTLDASGSYGSAGRQLQYFFGLMPGARNDKDVRGFLLSKVVKPYTMSSIELPRHLLMVGEEYRFVVKVSNFLDSTDSDLVVVKKVLDNGPAVFIEGPNIASVRSSQSFKLRGSAKLSACNVLSEDIDWQWSVASNVATNRLFTLHSKTRDTRNLFVPANALVPGYAYDFKLTGKMRENVTNFGMATVQVNCIYAPLIARISGGEQAISINRDLTLNATGSMDLDGDNAVGSFSFKWSCENQVGKECFDDVDGILLRDTGILHIPKGTLVPGVYYFRILVSKEPGPRMASATAKVYFVQTDQIDVAVLPLAEAKLNANARLVLDATLKSESACDGGHLPDFEWSQVSGDDVLKYPLTISTPITLTTVAFKPNVFTPGAAYRFRFAARCPKMGVFAPTKNGFGEIEVKINTSPSSGQFKVSPTVGKGTEDLFTLEMLNWVDDTEDLPMRYEFRYATEAAPSDQVPLGTVDANFIQARLPGPADVSTSWHKIVLLAFVVDQFEASTKSEFTVRVFKTNSTSSSRRLLQFSESLLDEHVATGNVEGIIQMTINLANDKELNCMARESMIEKLKNSAKQVEMNKAEVAGFSYAVKSALASDCVTSNARRLLPDSANVHALELTGSLVSNSMSAGLDPTAERGIADTLSSSLTGISKKNMARRSLRRLLSIDMFLGHNTPANSPFFRGREGLDFAISRKVSEGLYHVLGEVSGVRKQKLGDMLIEARDSLMSSQLNGAVTGEDPKGIVTKKIAMKSLQANPSALAGSKQGAGASSFLLPNNIFPPAAPPEMTSKSSNLADSPFDSDNEVGNVAGLSMGNKVKNLLDPIEIEMPSKTSSRRVPEGLTHPLQYRCVEHGDLAALMFWTRKDCVAACSSASGACIEMSSGACQYDEWDSCVDIEVDTCRFWNAQLNNWDGEGCIVQNSSASGSVMCHCYHLTDFGGTDSNVMPKMNVPDPSNPGAAFKNMSPDKILVIIILALFLVMYWVLSYWGWRQDRIDNERIDGKDTSNSRDWAQERKTRNAQQEEAMVQGNALRLLQKAMNGRLSRSAMMTRNSAVKLFQGQHKLFSAFYAKRHNYTRPRRFTVLFIMLIGNMMVNGFFCGNESASLVAKIVMGLIASLIMVPPTLFFKAIFMSLDVDPKTKARWEQENSHKAARKRQEMAMAMSVGPGVDGISAPPSHLHGVVPPSKLVRGYAPHPNHARVGVDVHVSTFAPRFRRKGQFLVNRTTPSRDVQRHSEDSQLLVSRELDQGGEVGLYLPRRALPIHSSPRPPAPWILNSRGEAVSQAAEHLHLNREFDEGSVEQIEFINKHDSHSKKQTRRLAGRAKFEAAVAKKLVEAISRPVDEKREKRKQLIDHRIQGLAYLLATIFYGVCFYFCLLLGVTFSNEIERAWLTALGLAILQDLFINETLVISCITVVKLVLVPRIASLISERIAKKYT